MKGQDLENLSRDMLQLRAMAHARRHTRLVGNQRHLWYTEKLWKHAADLAAFEVDPASIIDLDRECWFNGAAPTPREIMKHMKRILDADLKYPVILHPDGTIMDGAHRTCKALLHGMARIQAVQFSEAPPPCEIIPEAEPR